MNENTANNAVSFKQTQLHENIFISLNYIHMSYTGNFKEARVQLAEVDADISSLQSDLTSKISNREAQDGVLNVKIDAVNNGLFNYIHTKRDKEQKLGLVLII